MSKRIRGKCYIINIEHVHGMPPRKGTAVDGNNLRALFTQLHFEVVSYYNLTAEVSI